MTLAFAGPAYYVICGDSISEGLSNVNFPYPYYLIQQTGWVDKGRYWDQARSGYQSGDVIFHWPGDVAPLTVAQFSFKQGYFFMLVGTNNLAASGTAAALLADLLTLWAMARAAGLKVIAFTVMPSVLITAGAKETARLSVNASIAASGAFYDYLADASALLPDPNNATYYRDGTHLTNAGSLLLAQAVAALFTP